MGFDFDNIANKILNNEYKPLGRGSGRKVYDLGNGYVVKVAIKVELLKMRLNIQ